MKWLQKLWWRIRDWWLSRRLLVSPERKGEAQEAVNRVVYATKMPPDCVTAGVFRGGCSVSVKHDSAWEVFVHNTYAEAADEAIDWVLYRSPDLSYRKTTKLPRITRRAFDAQRRRKQKQEKKDAHTATTKIP